MNTLTNILLTSLVITLIYFLLSIFNDIREDKLMYGKQSIGLDKKLVSSNNKLVQKYRNLILNVFTEYKIEKIAEIVYYAILIISAILIIYFANIGQVFLAVISPIILNFFFVKILQSLKEDSDEKIEEQLPTVIDTIIRVFSKYGDLKSVIFETSRIIDEPLGTKFEILSRKMVSASSQEKALLSFADKLNNIWIYSLFSILISYKEDVSKDEAIANLKILRDIITKENELKNELITNTRLGVGVNYLICAISFAASLLNIFLNPMGKDFFFGSLSGIICFLLGYSCLFITLILNINMSKKKRKKV